MRVGFYLATLGLLCGCSPIVIEAGGSDDGGAASPRADGGATPVAYTGTIEQTPGSSSDAIPVVARIVFADDQTVTGTVFFGDGPPLPPPTDPSVGYPPSANGPAPNLSPDGFAYTILGGADVGGHVTFSILMNQLWKQWCELETPVPLYASDVANDTNPADLMGYGCLPNASVAELHPDGGAAPVCQLQWSDGTSMPVDCGKALLCRPPIDVCTCTQTSCTVDVKAPGNAAFDLTLSGSSLDGRVSGFGGEDFPSGNVMDIHLSR